MSTRIKAHSSKRLRVLVVDDNSSCLLLSETFVKRQGHDTQVARSAKEALEKIETETFDVILMDVSLPELDGLEATRIIRRRERETGTHVRIVAVTAHAMQSNREACFAAGMDAYVAKPVSAAKLVDVLTPPPPAGPVLVVDDDDSVRGALLVFLKCCGYETLAAENGARALEVLRDTTTIPSLILLDLRMPEVDGVQFRQRQLADVKVAHIPVIILSAVAEFADVRHLAPAACLEKAVDPDALLAAIDRHVLRGPSTTAQAPIAAPRLSAFRHRLTM